LPAALGPAAARASVSDSWRLARLGLGGLDSGAVSTTGLLVADESLLDLLPLEARGVVERMAVRRLAPLAGLTPTASARMRESAPGSTVRRRGRRSDSLAS